MKNTQFETALLTSIEGNKYTIQSDGTHTAIENSFYDEDFKNSVFVYKCLFFYEFEGNYCIDIWNGSHDFPTIEEMTFFIDTIDL